jgi:hypothetical protein
LSAATATTEITETTTAYFTIALLPLFLFVPLPFTFAFHGGCWRMDGGCSGGGCGCCRSSSSGLAIHGSSRDY